MENNKQPPVENSDTPSFMEQLLASEKAKDVLLEGAIKQGTYAIEKYKKASSIVEEGVLHLRVVLDVEGDYKPIVEVKIDDLFLGYINEDKENKSNEAYFKVECYKRGSGKWDRHTLAVTPVRKYSNYFNSASKKSRFAPTPGDSVEEVTVYIPVSMKRNWLGRKKDPSREEL